MESNLVSQAIFWLWTRHLYNICTTNQLLYKCESGFQTGHSTVHQLIKIYDQICKAIDDKKYYCMVFCDVSKAFDRVWHKGLLLKLEKYGIHGPLLHWLADYISNRSQSIFVNGALSKPLVSAWPVFISCVRERYCWWFRLPYYNLLMILMACLLMLSNVNNEQRI